MRAGGTTRPNRRETAHLSASARAVEDAYPIIVAVTDPRGSSDALMRNSSASLGRCQRALAILSGRRAPRNVRAVRAPVVLAGLEHDLDERPRVLGRRRLLSGQPVAVGPWSYHLVKGPSQPSSSQGHNPSFVSSEPPRPSRPRRLCHFWKPRAAAVLHLMQLRAATFAFHGPRFKSNASPRSAVPQSRRGPPVPQTIVPWQTCPFA